MADSFHTLKYAIRGFVRMRMTGVSAVAALALGIGAATTMASVAYAALYRQLPFPDAGRLAILYNTRLTPRDGLVRFRWSIPHIAELRKSATSFESLASFSSTSLGVRRVAGAAPPSQMDGEVVSPEYFGALRTAPATGRTFTQGEDGQPVMLISDRFWRAAFDADPRAAGETIRVSDVPLTVIGILPEGFSGLSGKADFWIPTWMAPRLSYGEYLTSPQHFVSVVARLKPDLTIPQANAELSSMGSRFADEPRSFDSAQERRETVWSAVALPATEARVDPTARRSVLLLFSASACVLLIACVNVAGVLLARARGRRREMAIRVAIGATRRRLFVQLLTEGAVVAAIAGVAGTLLAVAGVRLVGSSSPTFVASWRNDYAAISPFADPAIDARLLLFALAATLGTTLLASLLPAISASRPRPAAGLRAGERGATANARALSWLVVTQVAAAVLLLSGAGLIVGSLARLQQMRAGFQTERVLTFWIRPPVSRYPPETGPAAIEKFLAAIEAVPGVESAAVNRCTPFTGCARTTLTFTDRENVQGAAPVIGRHYISADYFDLLGIPLRAGRRITAGDRAGSAPVTVINETAARRFWPGQNAVGQHVLFGAVPAFMNAAKPVEVVGVVADVKYEGTDQPIGPDFYTSYLQFAYPDTMVAVKARSPEASLEPALRAAIAAADPAVPLYEVMSLEERVNRAIGRPRFNSTILSMFAVAAALLAGLGIYGVLSFTVSSRLREIGVGLALGAAPRRVRSRFVGPGVRMAAAGVAIGLAGAWLVTRAAAEWVADLGHADALLVTAVSIFGLAVAAVAALVPARRAAAVDPMVVLRND
jgi:predicted permease